MESGGAVETGAPKNKIWLGVLGAFLVAIVGLVIAIVVVKNLPRGEKESMTSEELAYKEYIDFQAGILSEFNYISSDNKDEVLKKYIDAANNTNNETLKVLLKTGYYQTIMTYDYDRSHKDEVLNGLIAIDESVMTVDSAVTVANAAQYYYDNELVERYNVIINDRYDGPDVGGEG